MSRHWRHHSAWPVLAGVHQVTDLNPVDAMTNLSPAAQAVLDAFRTSHTGQGCLAAALRAAATAIGAQELFHPDSKRTEGVKWCVQNIYAIADELEANAQ